MNVDDKSILDRFKKESAQRLKDREIRTQKMWENLVIDSVKDIPHLPVPLTDFHYEKLYAAGIIRKEDLEDGQTYLGNCRNADRAVWDASRNCFVYQRHKFGYIFPEDINHLADDNGYDLFVPIKKID